MVSARELVCDASVVLFDFDGVIADLFAGVHLREAIGRIRDQLGLSAPQNDDHLDIIRAAYRSGDHELLTAAETEVTALEVEAAKTATIFDGATTALVRLRLASRGVAIVTNNAPAAVHQFQAGHPALDDIPVFGRIDGQPEAMKPHPHLVNAAVAHYGLPTAAYVFLGDSTTDVDAGRAAGVRTIGIGDRAAAANPVAIIHSIRDLL